MFFAITKHCRETKSIFRYGLDIDTEFLLRGRNEYSILEFLSTPNPLFSAARQITTLSTL